MAEQHGLLEEMKYTYDWKQQRCGLCGMGHGQERRHKVKLGTRNLDKQIHERKTHWLKHLQWMPSEMALKPLFSYEPIGRRYPGRARRRWLDV
jgi:hypothetical protein